jgi:tetratricopeptide (TPR) repeat protein
MPTPQRAAADRRPWSSLKSNYDMRSGNNRCLPQKGNCILKFALFLVACMVIAGCRAPAPTTRSVEGSSANESSSGPAYYYFTAAQLKLKNGDVNEAVWLIEQAIRFDSDSIFLQLELANLLLIQKEETAALQLVQKVLSVEPLNLKALVLAGQIYQQQGKMDAALAAYSKALDLGPTDQNIYMMVGRLYWNKNDLDNAERVFRNMSLNVPDSYAAYYFYGKVLSAQGKSDAAEEALLKSLALEPSIEEPLEELLTIYQRRNQAEKITSTYQAIIRLNSQNHQAVLGLAQHYHRLGEDARALELLRGLAEKIDEDERIIPTLFDVYLEKKRFPDAIWALEGMLMAAPRNSDLHYMAGMAYDGAQETDTALAHLVQVLPGSRFYDNAVVHSALLFRDKGEIDRAIEVIQAALANAPEQVDYYLYLGSFYEELERFEEALAALQEGMHRDDKNARLYFRLGVVLDKMGRKQESIDAMKQVLALTPNDAEALNYLGYTYADLGINLEEAESLIQQALALKPDDGYIADSLGWVYFKKGNYRQALKWLNKAVQLVPDDPTILEHLGDVYNMLEQPGKALEYYRRSLEKRDDGNTSLEEKIRVLNGI